MKHQEQHASIKNTALANISLKHTKTPHTQANTQNPNNHSQQPWKPHTSPNNMPTRMTTLKTKTQ